MCQFCEANNQSAKLLTRNLIHKKKTTEFNIILLILKRNRKGDTKITGLIPEIQSFQMAVTKKQSIQSSRLYSKKFHSSINFIINSLLYDLIIHLKQFRTRFCAILEFQSSFRASEQFQSNFRAVSDQILSNFRVSEQFQSISRVIVIKKINWSLGNSRGRIKSSWGRRSFCRQIIIYDEALSKVQVGLIAVFNHLILFL